MSNPFRQSDRTPGQAGTGVPAPLGPRVSWDGPVPAQHTVACRPSTAVLAKLASCCALAARTTAGWRIFLAATRNGVTEGHDEAGQPGTAACMGSKRERHYGQVRGPRDAAPIRPFECPAR